MSNSNRRVFITTKSATLLATSAMALSLGCDGGSNVDIKPSAQLEFNTAALTSAELESANGEYGAGCTDRTGLWSLEIAPAAVLDNPALSVVKNNDECVLTLNSFIADGEEYIANPPIVMDGSFQTPSSAFSIDAGPVAFYGNAYLSSLTFGADFVVHLLYSDDANKGTASNTAAFAVESGSADAEGVPSPDYSLSMAGMALEVDSDDVVQTATGVAAFTDGTVTGQRYTVLTTMPATLTYEEIHDAFVLATKTAIAGADPTVAAAAFSLVGVDITTPVQRFVIIENLSQGVSSYQVYTVTFSAP